MNKKFNKKMKRIWLPVFLLGTLLAAVLMTGCGTDQKSAQDNTAEPIAAREGSEEESAAEESAAQESSADETIADENTADESVAGEDSGEEDTTEESTAEQSSAEGFEVSVGSLKGPTSMGLVAMMEKNAEGKCQDTYSFTMETAADVIGGSLVKGDLDIALLPANMAAILYQKTKGQIKVIDINTLSVLYMISANKKVQSVEDLRGQTIYLTGKGTTPDYVLRYLLTKNGISMEEVTLEYQAEAAEVVSRITQDEEAVGLLPQPFATVACAQNESLNIVIDCGQEWEDKSEDGSSVVTGVTVVRNEFLQKQEPSVRNFLMEHKESAEYAQSNVDETAAGVVKYGILEKEPIAKKAIPACNITYIDGTQMKQALSGYLKVLYDMDPESVGGELPGEDFYLELE